MRRVMLGLAVVGTVVAMLTMPMSAFADPASASDAAAGAQSINWGPCSEADLQAAGAQCGYLSVPLNYSDPSGPQIQLAVSRILHTSSAKNYQGVLITNPGGPGGPGLDLNTFLIPALRHEGFKAAAND